MATISSLYAMTRAADLPSGEHEDAGRISRRKFLLGSMLALGIGAVGMAFWVRRWKYIVIHHSGGAYGTIELLREVHKERQPEDPIEAVPYHFVIGNGYGLGVGKIVSDWRRNYHLWGAHVSRNNLDYNFRGIGICVIGNLEETEMPPMQFEALVGLTRILMAKYDIRPNNVVGHGMIEGESTKCPGRFFPVKEFRRAIAER